MYHGFIVGQHCLVACYLRMGKLYYDLFLTPTKTVFHIFRIVCPRMFETGIIVDNCKTSNEPIA